MCGLLWHDPRWAIIGRPACIRASAVFGLVCALRDDPSLAGIDAKQRVAVLAEGFRLKPIQVALVIVGLERKGILVDGVIVTTTLNVTAALNVTSPLKRQTAAGGASARTIQNRRQYLDRRLQLLFVRQEEEWRQRMHVTAELNITKPLKSPLSLVPTSDDPDGREVEMERVRARPRQGALMLPLPGGGAEGNAVGEKHDRGTRGSRLAESWWPDPENIAFAERLGLDPTGTAEQFRDYWQSLSGAKACKLDWGKTWRVWCRREAEKERRYHAAREDRRPGGIVAGARAVLAAGPLRRSS